jgi:hypothetical protein
MTEEYAREMAREIVQQVANQQPGIPDEEDPLEIEGWVLEAIAATVIANWSGCLVDNPTSPGSPASDPASRSS